MKISKQKVFARTNINGDVPPSTKLFVTTIANWLNEVLPWLNEQLNELARETKLGDDIFAQRRVLKINTGRQTGNTFALKAIAELYSDEMVVLFCTKRSIKANGFDKIPRLKVYSMFSVKKMLQDERLKSKVLFCDVPLEYIPREKWLALQKFGFKAIVVVG